MPGAIPPNARRNPLRPEPHGRLQFSRASVDIPAMSVQRFAAGSARPAHIH